MEVANFDSPGIKIKCDGLRVQADAGNDDAPFAKIIVPRSSEAIQWTLAVRHDHQTWCAARWRASTSRPKSDVGSRHTERAWLALLCVLSHSVRSRGPCSR
jgi:hypothetical protein